MDQEPWAFREQWYLIHTNPRQEDRAELNLRAWGVKTINPKLRETRPNPYSVTLTYVTKPLFPGYIFASFAFEKLYHKVRYTRGVHSLVCFGDEPTPVDDDIIEIIQERIDMTGFVKVNDQLKPGDRVAVKEGPLKNFIGVFERKAKDSDRVMILLQTVGYQAHYEIDVGLLEKIR
jgi:transcriptional antiterminator RfaH